MADIFPAPFPLTLASNGAYVLTWRTAIRTNGAMDVLYPQARQLTGQQMALIGEAVIALEVTKAGAHLVSIWMNHTVETALDIRGRAATILQAVMDAEQAGNLPPDARPFLV